MSLMKFVPLPVIVFEPETYDTVPFKVFNRFLNTMVSPTAIDDARFTFAPDPVTTAIPVPTKTLNVLDRGVVIKLLLVITKLATSFSNFLILVTKDLVPVGCNTSDKVFENFL